MLAGWAACAWLRVTPILPLRGTVAPRSPDTPSQGCLKNQRWIEHHATLPVSLCSNPPWPASDALDRHAGTHNLPPLQHALERR